MPSVLPLQHRFKRGALLCLSILTLSAHALKAESSESTVSSDTIRVEAMPTLSTPLKNGYLGLDDNDTILALSGTQAGDDILTFHPEASDWATAGSLEHAIPENAASASLDGLLLVGGTIEGVVSDQVWRIQFRDGHISQTELPKLPEALADVAIGRVRSKIYIAGGTSADGQPTKAFYSLDEDLPQPHWESSEPWPGQALSKGKLIFSQDMLFLVGGVQTDGSVNPTYRFHPDTGWIELPALANWPIGASVAPFGHSHAYLFGGVKTDGTTNTDIYLYHSITNTLAKIPGLSEIEGERLMAVTRSKDFVVTDGTTVLRIQPVPVETGYIWIDHLIVALYMLGMVWVGIYFSKREKGTGDYFRGGNRVPWWVSGMSLFATGASAISLMSLPGKAYATDWQYFTISICAVLMLPVSLYFIAPLIRRLKISTSNEYLERRFGLSVRIFGSILFILTQVCGRMASVMLLPAIALSAITGISIVTCILIMGVITTIYTYFGGLEAVVWTDTIQGFIMILSLGGCLLLALNALDMNLIEMWRTADTAQKLTMFDFSSNITYPTTIIFAISIAHLSLAGIGDQNFVQRVQCTPDMRQTKLAILTQMGVAIPINALLFSLGTALYLYYLMHPGDLDPTMKTDGIYPFFVAQNLPAGVSGLIVASLFAATMSTISSSLCSVSDLCVQDFYRRFSKKATDHSSLVLGRILTIVVGVAGSSAAIYLSKSDMTSVWDLAQLIIGLISCGVVGLFALGLLTKRTNELGAVVGIILGLLVVIYLKNTSTVTFWLYGPIGSTVTFITGYCASFILPGKIKNLEGLTVYSMPKGDE